MLLKSRFCYILPLLLIAATSVNASAPIGVQEYLAQRKKLATAIPIQELKANAGAYVGKVFEIRGVLTGTGSLKGNAGCSLIISTTDNVSYSITAETPPTPLLTQLACLVKIGEKSKYSLSDLQLVACTYLIELARVETPVKPVSEPKPAMKPGPAPKASAKPTQAATTITTEQFVGIYTKAVKRFNSRLTQTQADTIARSVIGFSLRYKIDARLVCAVILAESRFRINATSGSGAQGLGQLMPTTAAGLGVNDAYDPVQNIYGSVRYIKGMLDRMSGNKKSSELTWYDLALALAAYNAGPNAVKRHGGVPPYKETQNYVRKVTSIYKQLCGVK